MKTFIKTGASMLLCMAIIAGTTGCSKDDPDYENVTPPEVVVAPNTLSGIITNINGDVIANATITLGGAATATAKTDAGGMFLFPDVKAGTYTVKAEAAEKIAQEGTIVVENSSKSQKLVWNTSLASDVKEEIAVSATEESKGEVATEAVKGNEKAEVKVEAVIPAGAVEAAEGEVIKIEIAPIYSQGNASNTRAESASTMLVGSTLKCSKSDAVLKEPIELVFNVDAEMAGVVEAKLYKNNQWVSAKSSIAGGKVIISATEFAAYGLFLNVTYTEKAASEAITFKQNKWDNLYGSKEMKVTDATYNYKLGTEISSKGTTVLTALLIEKLAQKYGNKMSPTAGSYPLNVTLPVGTALTVSGTLQKTNVTVAAKSNSATGVKYGTVTISTATSNRQHTGGGN